MQTLYFDPSLRIVAAEELIRRFKDFDSSHPPVRAPARQALLLGIHSDGRCSPCAMA